MRALLDSGAYSAFMSGSHRVREIVHDAEEILMSAVVVGELLYGFRQGPRLEQNLAELRAKGRPIPTNDVWIAAHAMETGADLVSADSHFGHIDQVVWVNAEPD